eukprot:2826252-Lingulodinium_polyedra.AAC.1
MVTSASWMPIFVAALYHNAPPAMASAKVLACRSSTAGPRKKEPLRAPMAALWRLTRALTSG